MVRRVTKTSIATAKTQKPVTSSVADGPPLAGRRPTFRTRELADPASRVGP
ncbi:hypothetical protein B0G74_6543 [Paraburkholderia sp. BL9I2N2]|jgi:hypothetical protein|nr:hypothetical protein B0G74_6543 [Paraburkholderia sp. BL9I2N2]